MNVNAIARQHQEADALHTRMGVQGFFDNYTILNKDGSLALILKALSCDMTCLDPLEKEQIMRRFRAAVHSLPPNVTLTEQCAKRRSAPLPIPAHDNPAVKDVLVARTIGLNTTLPGLFEIEVYWVLTFHPERSAARQSDRVMDRLKSVDFFKLTFSSEVESAQLEREIKKDRDAFHNIARAFRTQLADIAHTEMLDKHAAFGFLRDLVNPARRNATLAFDGMLDWQISDSVVEVFRDHLIVGNHFVQVVTLKTPPQMTEADVLRGLRDVHSHWRVVSEWQRIPNGKMRARLQSKRRHHKAAEISVMAAMSKPVPGHPQNALVNHSAAASVDELGECQKLMDVDGRAIGEFSLTIVITGEDLAEVKRAVSQCANIFAARGGAVTEETYNLLNAWLACGPGNGAHNLRRVLLFDTNHADLSMLGTPGSGDAMNQHLNAECLAILQTREGTPYYFNLHYGDVGHCAIFGSTGSGKSFLVNFELLMLQKYTPFIFIFDLGGSYQRVVEYLSGKHVRVGGEGTGLRFNPFSLPPTSGNLQMLHRLLLVLLNAPEHYDPVEAQQLFEHLQNLYELEPSQRTLSTLAGMLSRQQAARLSRWLKGGQYGHVFDNVEDTLTFARIQSFDFQDMEKVPELLEPILFYILHCANQSIHRPADHATLKCFVVDEAWKFFRHPVIRAYIVEALKTWRKRNGLMIMATQSMADFVNSEMLPVVMENCPTKLFLANHGMDQAVYQSVFHLSETEAKLISELRSKGELLMKRPDSSRVLALDVDPFLYNLCQTSGPVAGTDNPLPKPTTRSDSND